MLVQISFNDFNYEEFYNYYHRVIVCRLEKTSIYYNILEYSKTIFIRYIQINYKRIFDINDFYKTNLFKLKFYI